MAMMNAIEKNPGAQDRQRNPDLGEADAVGKEEVKAFRTRPGLPDPLVEEMRIRGPMPARVQARPRRVATCTRNPDRRRTEGRSRENNRGIQQRAERSDVPLNPELERGAKERQSNKQRGGLFPRDSSRRGRVALP